MRLGLWESAVQGIGGREWRLFSSFFYRENIDFFASTRIGWTGKGNNQGFPARGSGKEFNLRDEVIRRQIVFPFANSRPTLSIFCELRHCQELQRAGKVESDCRCFQDE